MEPGGTATERNDPADLRDAVLAASLADAGRHEADLLLERRAKVDRLRADGVEPFQRVFPDRDCIADVLAAHEGLAEAGDHSDFAYRVAGRVAALRGHGKTIFIDIVDRSGRMQLYARGDALDDAAYERVLDLDHGDVIGVAGCIYVTKRGDLALKVREMTLLAKALRPPPEKFHGLADVETRSRRRELDLVANEESRELFVTRAKIISAVRRFFDGEGFVEVETPVLQPLYGGALARPFITQHNALDRSLYLRISMELYLKRCLVGGLENVYDLSKCFRNEGLSHHHNPEFTIVEWFQAYTDYLGVIAFIEQMVASVAQEVLGTTVIERDGHEIDLGPPWRRVGMCDAIRDVTGVDVLSAGADELADAIGDGAPRDSSWDRLVAKLFGKHVEPTLIQPTFVLDYPAELWAVGRPVAGEPRLVESFDAIVGGMEIGSGSTDLNDPDEQRARFLEQRSERSGDRDDGHPYDADFVRALEHGMLPAAGAGLGIDRLVMLLTGRESLRDVILFPAMRSLPQGGPAAYGDTVSA
ncbi:MAG: lysyl-tRNA synthetase, class [Solirubrobacteraceae bacterium]|jgi:lysyl-tRNA synthetase class 2|nr:lysyl-tRNA synthetase, class [Solirubrobacteraceae bacterium]